MILNSLFLIIVAVLCYVRYKEACIDCSSDKAKDIFQILFVGICTAYFVGIAPILKLFAILMLSFVVKELIFRPFETPEKKEKCGNCIDKFK